MRQPWQAATPLTTELLGAVGMADVTIHYDGEKITREAARAAGSWVFRFGAVGFGPTYPLTG